jgi:hypothetical protein
MVLIAGGLKMKLSSIFSFFTKTYWKENIFGYFKHRDKCRDGRQNSQEMARVKNLAEMLSENIDRYSSTLKSKQFYEDILRKSEEELQDIHRLLPGYEEIIAKIRADIDYERSKRFCMGAKTSDYFFHQLKLTDLFRDYCMALIKKKSAEMKVSSIEQQCRSARLGHYFHSERNPEELARRIYDISLENNELFDRSRVYLSSAQNAVIDEILLKYTKTKRFSEFRSLNGEYKPENIKSSSDKRHDCHADDLEDKIESVQSYSKAKPVYKQLNSIFDYYRLDELIPDTSAFLLYSSNKLYSNNPRNESNNSSAGSIRQYIAEITKFVQYRNDKQNYSLKHIVALYNSSWIKSSDDAITVLKSAVSQGFYLNRYDSKIASDEMKSEMVRDYSLNISTSLKNIAKQLSSKYGMNVSEKTIRKYAKKQLEKQGILYGRKYGSKKILSINQAC